VLCCVGSWVEDKREFLKCAEDSVRWSLSGKLLYDNRFDVHALNATILAAAPDTKRTAALLTRQPNAAAGTASSSSSAAAAGATAAATTHDADAAVMDDDDQQCIGLSTNPISALRFTQPQSAHQQILERILGSKPPLEEGSQYIQVPPSSPSCLLAGCMQLTWRRRRRWIGVRCAVVPRRRSALGFQPAASPHVTSHYRTP
jgi:hypothetical protein